MKTVPSSRRNRYVAIVSIVLVVVALVVWMVIRLSAPSYDLTIASTDGGSVTTPGEAGPYNYDEGTVVNLVAEVEEGYRFVNWTGNVGTIGNVEATTTTITMNDNYTITANFAVEPQYSLIITSTEGGEVTEPGEGVFNYDEGTVVDLVAEAEEGYHFVNWTGDMGTIADIDDATTTITMNGGYSITANFVAVYDLIISSTEGGSVTTPGEGTFAYDEGTVVNLVATPDAYYHFVSWAGDVGTIDNVEAAATTITMNGDYYITAEFGVNPMVAAGDSHTVGLKSDGTVVAVGDETFGRCNVDGWTGIVQVAAGGYHTVGVKSDGTVVAVGRETAGQLNVGGWTDIVQVAAGESHTLGLKSDGSVVTAGDNSYLQRNISWTTGIVQVAAGRWHTVGLKSDGTVLAMGYNDFHQCDVGGWTGITQVAGGGYHTVGLKSDGTVVAVGRSSAGQLDVDDWTDIVQVAAGDFHTVGLKADGTVVAVGYVIGDVGGWDLD